MATGGISLRAVTAVDDELLFDIYALTRRGETESFGWDDAQKEAFLRMQFASRRGAYSLQFPAAEYLVIEDAGEPVGSLILERRAGELRLVDIAVLPQFRRRGVASETVARLQGEGLPITLHVDKGNATVRLFYDKHGFVTTGETATADQMKWHPTGDRDRPS